MYFTIGLLYIPSPMGYKLLKLFLDVKNLLILDSLNFLYNNNNNNENCKLYTKLEEHSHIHLHAHV